MAGCAFFSCVLLKVAPMENISQSLEHVDEHYCSKMDVCLQMDVYLHQVPLICLKPCLLHFVDVSTELQLEVSTPWA